jgi:hypothetical protein
VSDRFSGKSKVARKSGYATFLIDLSAHGFERGAMKRVHLALGASDVEASSPSVL